MGLDHAIHNEELCRKIYFKNCFFDWVVTIAFYSALHYSQYELFPFQVGKTIYHNFDDYYNVFKSNMDNKHQARQRLVYSNISASAGAAYRYLKDNCWSARYYSYVVDKSDATIALKKLDIIKSHLSKLSIVQDS